MTSSRKNNGKIWTSAKPNKLYIIRKILIRAIQKCTFLEFEPLSQVANFDFISCKFRPYKLHAHSDWAYG